MLSVSSLWKSAVLFAVITVLVICFFDKLSDSVDLAHHYALVARIFEYGYFFPEPDLSLGEMNEYPRLSHAIAAVIGHMLGSPLLGIQVLVFASLLILWGSIFKIFRQLPSRVFGVAFFLLIAALVGFRALYFLLPFPLPLPLLTFGSEVVVNFFFAQLVAQAFLFLLLLCSLMLEKKAVHPSVRYLLLAGGLLILEWIHVLPVIEALAFMFLLVCVDAYLKKTGRLSGMFYGIVFVFALTGLVFLHPSFSIMQGIASHNGGLQIPHITTITRLFFWCMFVFVSSSLLVALWVFRFTPEMKKNSLPIKYIGLFGMAICLTCFSQMFLLYLGHGSEYACRKYIFALDTLLILSLSLLPMAIWTPHWFADNNTLVNTKKWEKICQYVSFPLILILVFTPLSLNSQLSLFRLLSLEEAANTFKDMDVGLPPGHFDYAVSIPGHVALEPYLISIGVFQAPRDGNILAIIYNEKNLPFPSQVNNILTSMNDNRYDSPACRKAVFNNTYVFLSGTCVFARPGSP